MKKYKKTIVGFRSKTLERLDYIVKHYPDKPYKNMLSIPVHITPLVRSQETAIPAKWKP